MPIPGTCIHWVCLSAFLLTGVQNPEKNDVYVNNAIAIIFAIKRIHDINCTMKIHIQVGIMTALNNCIASDYQLLYYTHLIHKLKRPHL